MTPAPPAPPAAAANPADAVKAPAALLLGYGLLGALNGLSGLVLRPSPEELRKQYDLLHSLLDGSGVERVVFPLLDLALSGWMSLPPLVVGLVVAAAGWQMWQRRTWPLAMAGAVLAALPCVGPCCCVLGTPLGVWAAMTLAKPEVKAAFERPG